MGRRPLSGAPARRRRLPFSPAERRCGDDSGAATIAVLGLIAVLATVTVAVLVVVGAVLASHRARLAADLSAIAGATRLQRGATPAAACAVASSVADRNGGHLTSCGVTGAALAVTVVVPTRGWPDGAVARARAGPAS